MKRFLVVAIVLPLLNACASRTFTNIGDGVGIPSETIRKRAQTENVSFKQASQMIREDRLLSQPGAVAKDR